MSLSTCLSVASLAFWALGVFGPTHPAQAEAAPPCSLVEVEYALSPSLELSDTPKGQGNGVYPIGPGKTVVRFDEHDGVPSGPAKMMAYETTERFAIQSTTLFWKTRVTTDAKTVVAKDACGVVASGNLKGSTLEWTTDIHGARTDGTLTCEGSLCGKFGAPPPGTSQLHIPPHDVRFHPWVFGPGNKTFTMGKTWLAHSESPKQTSH